jgi:hypothetical protein
MTDDVVAFLKIVLANGPMLVSEIEKEARDARVLGDSQTVSHSKPFRAARKVLGIEPQKSGYQGTWTWALPVSPARHA